MQIAAIAFRASRAASGLILVGLVASAEPPLPTEHLSYSYHWEDTRSVPSNVQTAFVNQPRLPKLKQTSSPLVDDTTIGQLVDDFNILLIDSPAAAWTQRQAEEIRNHTQAIPRQPETLGPPTGLSRWRLTTNYIEDDIFLSPAHNPSFDVLISTRAFTHAQPQPTTVDGIAGTYYSQRLRQALVRFVTNNGDDRDAIEYLLQQRYGVTTIVPNYQALTANTTNETAERFQAFHSEELLNIISMFEEMPKDRHRLPDLRYLVRRLDATNHPLYEHAPAVSWTARGYIEFMESAFYYQNVDYTKRLILHEKTHFLWDNHFDEALKVDWALIGDWSRPTSSTSNWYTSQQTEFVSAYAHALTPSEDMAESLAHYIINPDKLRSRAPAKYNFIRDRIMGGSVYLSQAREDLTFKLEDLQPDYMFPTEIKRIDIEVSGDPDADKLVTVEIELHTDKSISQGGASLANFRLTSEIGTFVDVALYPQKYPVDAQSGGNSSVLRGTVKLSQYVKSGSWQTSQIVLTDTGGNSRMQKAQNFGWQLHIDSPKEDTSAPLYIAKSASLSLSTQQVEGAQLQIIQARWRVNEESAMSTRNACYASLNDEVASTYRHEQWGQFDAKQGQCHVDFLMPNYKPTSVYNLRYISMHDAAKNKSSVYFTKSNDAKTQHPSSQKNRIDEAAQSIVLITSNPDTQPPKLNLNTLAIETQPTHPNKPDGETTVSILFSIADDISGFKTASLKLKDPQGISHQFYMSNEPSLIYAKEVANEEQRYYRTIVLPAGSAPGTWSLANMTIYDRAGNIKSYDFTETMHFDIITGLQGPAYGP